jgi:tetratricopeptide (TPR) repeat protein
MCFTRTLTALFLLFAFLVPACEAQQLGKPVMIPAGSDADHQLNTINNADPSQKLALIDAFSKAFPESDMQIVADEQYVNYYLNAKRYDKAFEYGDKLFALDPDNYLNAVNMVRAGAEKGDLDRLYTYGERANSILSRYKAAPPPEGVSADDWARLKSDKLATLKEDQDYVEQCLLNGAYNARNPGKKADDLVRFAKMYPGTPQSEQALMVAATAYQQAENRGKMQEVANNALAKDPNNIDMMLLLADDYSENGDQLDKAEAYARKAISLSDTAKKPDQLTDEQWNQQTSIQKGWAYSTIGQVNLQKRQESQAVGYLLKAGPFLKSNPGMYARNQYRLGFAYLNLKKTADATKAFTEAAAIDSPYKAMAQQKLDEIGAAKPGAHKKAS